MKYTIHARGKEGKEIKVVSAIPGKNGENGFALHFPCLSVHVLRPNDNHDTEYDCITWSNYHERGCADEPHDKGGPQQTPNPGTFRIKRVQHVPEMIVIKDSGNGRKMSYSKAAFPSGKPMYDYCAMAMQWGTSYDMTSGWDFGPNHPMERTDEELAVCEGVDSIERELEQRFGDFGETILELFVTHELFRKYLTTEELRIAA